MLVKPQRKHGPNAEMNVVPYIDVMLVLLVIFMVTALGETSHVQATASRVRSSRPMVTLRPATASSTMPARGAKPCALAAMPIVPPVWIRRMDML